MEWREGKRRNVERIKIKGVRQNKEQMEGEGVSKDGRKEEEEEEAQRRGGRKERKEKMEETG